MDSKHTMYIKDIKQVSVGVYKIHPTDGPVFFIRDSYFGIEAFETLYHNFRSFDTSQFAQSNNTETSRGPNAEGFYVNDEQIYRLIDASETYLAERYATGLLNRSEQSRFLLFQKLLKKKYASDHINEALNFLESKGYLSDLRFSKAWIRQRVRSKKENRSKLYQGLLARNINGAIANEALDEVFEEFDIDETELLQNLIDVYVSKQYDTEKIIKKCINKGYTLKEINKILS